MPRTGTVRIWVWAIGDLLDAQLALEPNRPVRTIRKFTVIDGEKA